MKKDEIILELDASTRNFLAFCSQVDDRIFFRQPRNKWSIAQQVKHLVQSANITKLAYTIPKFISRLYVGKPNRHSRSFDELVTRYKTKLAAGGKASGPFIPKKIAATIGKTTLLDDFRRALTKVSSAIVRNKEADLDKYLAPHPLLGKITLRELAYFTIHHTYHHLESIRKLALENERDFADN